MNRHSDIVKQKAINLYRTGTPAAEVAMSLSIPRKTSYKLLEKENIVTSDLTKSRFPH